MRDVVLDLACMACSGWRHEPRSPSSPVELESVFLHEATDAQHRRAVLEHQEPGVHAEVGEVDLELALRLDDAVRRSQAHVGARPHAFEDVARQRVVGAEVVGRPGVGDPDDLRPVLARKGRHREVLLLCSGCQRPATNGSRNGLTWSYTGCQRPATNGSRSGLTWSYTLLALRAKYGVELRMVWGVTAMHGLAPFGGQARGLTRRL